MTTSFETIARLFGPVGADRQPRLVEADAAWRLPSLDGVPAIWGRAPSLVRPTARLLPEAMRREVSLAILRGTAIARRRPIEVHRLPPPRRGGRMRGAVRGVLLSGAVAIVGMTESRRMIDAVLEAANGSIDGPLRFSGDGALRVRIATPDGPAELRVVRRGTQRDPETAAAAMTRLAALDVPNVPRLLARGSLYDVAWSTESALPGVIPKALSARLADDVVSFCASLVAPGEPITSTVEALGGMGRLAPGRSDEIAALQRWASSIASGLPAVVQHGDLWIGNLLVADDRLTGVVDWDTWHPAGVPGADLLQVVAMQERRHTKEEPGDLLVRRIWETPAYRRLADRYWALLGVRPTPAQRALVAVDWWACQVASTLERPIRGRLADDASWRHRNIGQVLDAAALLLGMEVQA